MKVWDLPTRMFHWLIVLVVGFSWYSAETGMMEWHYRSGLAALGLLAFRVIWGFAGGSTARFSQFIKSPRGALSYLRNPATLPTSAGHNPLGGYSVLAMLSALLLLGRDPATAPAIEADRWRLLPLSLAPDGR